MTHPRGSVIVPCQETARYHRFSSSLVNLALPTGSRVMFGMGTSIVDNLNNSIRQLRPGDEWVWIVGDDHVFEADTLTRLLDCDADMIAPLCVRRGPPFPLVHYQDELFAESGFHQVMQFDDLPDTDEPFEVQVTGSLMLIRRGVLDAIGDPWFSNSPGRMDEEFSFCEKVRAAGFRILVDPSVAVGHIGEIITRPARDNSGAWGLDVEFVGAANHHAFYPGGMHRELV